MALTVGVGTVMDAREVGRGARFFLYMSKRCSNVSEMCTYRLFG